MSTYQTSALKNTTLEPTSMDTTDKNVNDLILSLATLLQKHVPRDQAGLAFDFVHKFYTNPSVDNLARMDENELVDGLLKMWHFFYERAHGKPKIRVYHWQPSSTSSLAERIIIDIVDDNRSFTLDSLYGLLERLGTKARTTLHPIIGVERDAKGIVKSLASPTQINAKQHLESVIHCEIVDHVSADLVRELELAIPDVLQDVKWTNEDWKAMRSKAIETISDLESYRDKGFLDDTLDEVINFMQWIENDHYTFLGYCNYDLVENDPKKIASRVKSEGALGVLRDDELSKLQTLFDGIDLNQDTKKYIFDAYPVIINKTSCISHVHRNVRMDCVGVRRYDDTGKVIGIRLFVGLFTSVAYDSSARDIPLLRTKILKIVERAGFTPDWHDGKALIHILDSLPRDEVFQGSIAELTDIGLRVLRLEERRRLAFFMRRDQFNRFLSCLVYIPRDRFDTELCDRIGEILSTEFEGTVGTYKAQYGELAFARVHYTIHSASSLKESYDLAHIESLLIDVSRTWADELKFALMDQFPEVQSASLYRRYRPAFDRAYQDRYKGRVVLEDLVELEQVYKGDGFRVRIYGFQGQESSSLHLKIYNRGNPLPLSDVLPILENLDLKVISEVPYKVCALGEEDTVWINDFNLQSRGGDILNIEQACQKFEDTLIKVRSAGIENDSYNRLVLRANLDWWQCNLFRAYGKYLRLIGLPFSKAYLSNTLARHADITGLMAQLFEQKFHPKKGVKHEPLLEKIQELLDQISNADEDRILRLYLNVMTSTIRTNAYQPGADGKSKSYLSFKISSRTIDEIPKPKPLYEVFVYASYMEGIHLRGGKVARGGIRWSDRQEDFRTEVLSLVKAQMVKNTVIVPVGSKGGFIVKSNMEGKSREEIFDEGVRCYQTLIRGLLDITDNLVNGNIVPPRDVIRLDEDDPYLVVAADKGTATFSDFANAISNEYGFWLGDAFASGGSVGYDHKKMGITARGAWESVKRHFREMGINTQTDPFTVVGIGDMSGDVFGNGMLLSRQIKLVGAFNHMHIFIDPNPDPEKSFVERERLFKLPRSTWDDYDRAALSEGAGIYLRSAKTITVTKEIQQMLGLTSLEIRPDHLIQTLLKHSVDLLWFGGIGTYIKSSRESHSDVGDRANDNIRINGEDIRAQVVAEGANLGCTQLGRIEYERETGGRINTDAIDNSAGVSCSDREVNIKILFNAILAAKKLTLDERNVLLEKMTADVARLVLRDNYLQPQIITDSTTLGSRNLDQQIQLIRGLEQSGLLDRQVEFLPDDTTLEEYQATQTSLARAEFATLLGYSKIDIYDRLLKTDLPDDPYFVHYLRAYFPPLLQEKYDAEILNHPLRREIIATYAVNSLINRMGPSFITEAMAATSTRMEDVFKAYFTVMEVFQLPQSWEALDNLDTLIDSDVQTNARLDIYKIARRTAIWLLRYYPMASTITDTANILQIGIDAFVTSVDKTLNPKEKKKLDTSIHAYQQQGLPDELATRLSLLKTASLSPDIILIANEAQCTVPKVAELYFRVGQAFYFSMLREILDQSTLAKTRWERRLSSNLLEDIFNAQSDLVITLLHYSKENRIETDDKYKTLVKTWSKANHSQVSNIEHAVKESQIEEKPDLTAMSVIVRELRQLCALH